MMKAYLSRTSPPGLRRKNLGGGDSMKSSRSSQISRVKGILRLPASNLSPKSEAIRLHGVYDELITPLRGFPFSSPLACKNRVGVRMATFGSLSLLIALALAAYNLLAGTI